jgi:predicted ATPase/signal transduction histidine kinase/tRNA A-37 threonylcarbamoyl transferase component Bud32
MLELTGHTVVAKIYQGDKTIVYRGYRTQDNQPVIIKVLQSHYSDAKKVAKFHHEYEITKNLDLAGIIKPYELLKHKNTWVLILEDIQGDSLKTLLATQKLELVTFLPIAIKLAGNLGELQAHNIIHKDIKPANIIVNLKTGQVKLTDFSISSRLSLETPTISHSNLLEGTLAYMSPEQTGRMNRVLDYRTDFYSLGIVFYEILVGHPPFQNQDAMELVHSHIAKRPTPPYKLNPLVPRALSHIVMKLLAKTAEARYQSAEGLQIDLTHCLQQLQTTGKIEEFICGRQDLSDKFQIAQKLYGRDKELGKLLQAFEHVRYGAIEIMLVTGNAGIGKSSLISELYKPIVQRHGYFIVGKFEQLQRHLPYSALLQAFRELIAQILTETEEQIVAWRTLLLTALGHQGQVLIEVLPELEIIIGSQSKVLPLSSSEAQNRFNLVFQQFIKIFASPSHPLVIFLDDLQWADSTTLKLLATLVTNTATTALFLIGAYQEHEVTASHPLLYTLVTIQEADILLEEIHLTPLSLVSISHLIADTLHCNTARALPLADLILRKTDGNPFFVKEFLRTLYHNRWLHFDARQKTWVWDLNQIQQCTITDNVVDLIVNQMQELPLATQTVLQLAACIGNQFDILTLSLLSGQPPLAIAKTLLTTLAINLCMPIGEAYEYATLEEPCRALVSDNAEETRLNLLKCRYRFTHNRIQQAAYSLIAEEDKPAVHYRIGKLLYANIPADDLDDYLCEIVNHWNQGGELIESDPEKILLAELNLRAGRHAKTLMAYSSALTFLNAGLTLLGPESWQHYYYDLTLDLHVETIETAYLNTDFVKADHLATLVLHHAKTALDTVKVYETKILFYISQNNMSVAIETAVEILAKLEINWCDKPPARSIAELSQLPDMTNPVTLSALRILMVTGPAAYITRPELFPRLIFTMLDLCSNYGNTAVAAFGYAGYGLILSAGLGEVETGYQAGNLALNLLERFGAKTLKPRVYELVYGHLRLWKEPLRTTLEPLQQAIETGIETGEMEYASYSALLYCNHLLFVGEPLGVVAQKQQQYLDMIQQFKQLFHLYFLKIWQQTVSQLMGQTSRSAGPIKAAKFAEEEIFAVLLQANNRTSLFAFHLSKCILHYLFKNYAQAIEQAELAKPYEAAMLGLIHIAELNFYHSLARLAQARQFESLPTADYLEPVQQNQIQLQRWACHAPMNYQHKYNLVAAELARFQGRIADAMKLYEQAIDGANAEGYLQEVALANELAADFYIALGHEKIAHLFLAEAHSAYLTWGALAKVKELQQQYPHLGAGVSSRAPHHVLHSMVATVTTATTLSVDSPLDFTTVIKASQALSSEIVLEHLIQKLMHIVMENVGAEEGWLLLNTDVQHFNLVLEAHATVEEVQMLKSLPLETVNNTNHALSHAIVKYVARTLAPLVLSNASQSNLFTNDPYIAKKQPKSLLCMPVINKNQLIGILYLENNLITGAFTPDRLTVLKLLSTQMAISLENAMYYAKLEQARQVAEQARREAEAASQAKSTFLAKMSHELRTPLNAILGYSDMIREEAEELNYEDILPDLHKIQTAGKHLLGIISNILDISKIEAAKIDLHLSEFAVTDLIAEVVMTIQPLVHSAGLLLVVEEAKELGTLQTDRHKLTQILLNLLNNATKFTNHGTITFTIHRQTLFSVSKENNQKRESTWLFFQVADTGIGIPQEQMNLIFEAFTQADNSSTRRYEGTGLGLTISEHFCRALGGNISLTSELGKGSIFTVQLPVGVILNSKGNVL